MVKCYRQDTEKRHVQNVDVLEQLTLPLNYEIK